MANVVEIIFKAIDQVTKNTDKITSSMKSMLDIGSKLAAGLTVVGVTMKKVFDLGKEAASITQTRKSFDDLMKKIGASPDIFRRLQDASRGTVDDLTLMSSTMVLLAGTSDDFAKTLSEAAPGILEIAKAANKLNPALGDTNFLYQSLMLGIKRGSPMIIDNTGLTLRLGEANQKMATKLGKSVEQLTSEEIRMALLNATMEAGAGLIAQVGGNVDSATDSFARLEASTKNLGDSLKSILAPGLTSAATATNTLLTWNKTLRQAFEDNVPVIEKNSSSYDDYMESLEDAAKSAGLVIKETENGIEVYKRQGMWLLKAKDDFGVLTESQFIARDSTQALTERQQAYVDLLSSSTATMNPYLDALRSSRDAVSGVDYETQNLIASNQELVTSIMNGTSEMWNINEAFWDTEQAAKNLEQKVADLSTIITGELGESMDGFYEQLGDLNIEALTLQAKLEELSGVDTEEARAEYGELQGKLEDVRNKIDDVTATHDEHTKKILYNLLLQRASIDGVTQAEYALLLGIAESWGMVDQATVQAMTAADQAFTDLANGEGLSSVQSELQNTLNQLGFIDGYQANATVNVEFNEINKPPYFGTGGNDPGWFGGDVLPPMSLPPNLPDKPILDDGMNPYNLPPQKDLGNLLVLPPAEKTPGGGSSGSSQTHASNVTIVNNFQDTTMTDRQMIRALQRAEAMGVL